MASTFRPPERRAVAEDDRCARLRHRLDDRESAPVMASVGLQLLRGEDDQYGLRGPGDDGHGRAALGERDASPERLVLKSADLCAWRRTSVMMMSSVASRMCRLRGLVLRSRRLTRRLCRSQERLRFEGLQISYTVKTGGRATGLRGACTADLPRQTASPLSANITAPIIRH